MADITIRGLRKSYGSFEVVHAIDLDVRDGEFLFVLGPSGCDKSTLLRLIAGLEEISGGEIAIGGRVVNRLEPRERGCAMVFQNYALYPHMTVADNIGYALRVAGVSKRERMERIARVAKILELDALLDRKPAALSGGQRQRVAMGRAIIREPSVFLFDEPLSNLDAKLRVQMRIEIRRLHQRLNATSIFVTHDQIEAMTLADRLVVMNAGRIEQIGAPAEVYRRPSTHYVAGFIGSPAMNFFEARAVAADRIAFGGNAALDVPRNTLLPPAGNALILGVRPEEIQITNANGDGALPFDVEMVEELGAGRLLYGRLADADCVVASPSTMASPPGQRVFVRILPESVHLFSAETGGRIEAAG
jgi:sn-glycerol 3-phosphate transport system ATP-binding protein